MPWKMCTLASSEAEANKGYFLWNATERSACEWYRNALYGFVDRSRSYHASLLSCMTLANQLPMFDCVHMHFTGDLAALESNLADTATDTREYKADMTMFACYGTGLDWLVICTC